MLFHCCTIHEIISLTLFFLSNIHHVQSATTFITAPPPNLHLRMVNNTYVLASGVLMTNSSSADILESKVPAVGDIITAIDGSPLATHSLSTLLNQIGTTSILPIIDSTENYEVEPSYWSSNNGNTVDPGWKIRGFVRIETFMPAKIELKPGFPARVNAFKVLHEKLVQQQKEKEERAKLEAETAALQAAQAQRVLDQRKHELALQESKRKLQEEEQKHELAKSMAEKAAVEREVEIKHKEQKDEMAAKSLKEANEKTQLAAMAKLEKDQAEKDRIERSNRRKKAEEQKKRDKADKMKQIEEPGFEYFDVTFRSEGSLDLWFKPGVYLPTLEQKRAGTKLVPNDVLVGINKEPLPVPGDMNIVMERLQEASLPRTLRWKRAIVAEEENVTSSFDPLQLFVRTPTIVAGKYELTSALFGSNDTCTGVVNISFAFPSKNGCKGGLKRTSVSDPKNSIVCVLRGTCNFVVKLRNVQKSGAKAMVVINNKKETFAMPAGNFKVDDLIIPAAMAIEELGDVMSAITLIAKKLRLGASVMQAQFIGGNSSCAEGTVNNGGDSDEVEAAVVPATMEFTEWSSSIKNVPPGIPITLGGPGSMKIAPDDGRGILYLWNGINTMAFEVMRASFGASDLSSEPFVLKLAKPIYGCRGTAGNTRRSMIVVERGECPFIKKAQVAQAQGARALFVINNDENLFSMPAPEIDGKGIKIPVAMLPLAAKEYLTKSTMNGDLSLVARLAFKVFEDIDSS
jgi:hypothetical protein